MPAPWGEFLQLGVGGVVLLVLFLVVRSGDLRTRFELLTEQARRTRAETQTDTLLATVERLTDELHENNRLLAGLVNNRGAREVG